MQFSRKSYHFRCQGMDVRHKRRACRSCHTAIAADASAVGNDASPRLLAGFNLSTAPQCPTQGNLEPQANNFPIRCGQRTIFWQPFIFAVLGRSIFMVLFVCVCGCNSHQPRLSGEKGKDHIFRVGDELFNPKKGSYCSLRENSHGPIALYR